MDILQIINKYYNDNKPLKASLLTHSEQVKRKALEVVNNHPELQIDLQMVSDGAMAHDIGIFKTHAPSIHCHGDADYLMHGFLGAEIMRQEGYESLARICERHTGTGLSSETIRNKQLPVEVRDYFPETLEEKVICYADKFYSKSNLQVEKSPEEVYQSLRKHGKEVANKFLEWHKLFG